MARNAAISVLRSLGAEATAPAMAAVGLTRSITGWHIFQKEKGQEWQGLPAVEKASYRLLAKGVDLQDFLDVSASLKPPKKKTSALIEALALKSKSDAIIAAAMEQDKLKKKQKEGAATSSIAAILAEQELQEVQAQLLQKPSLESVLEWASVSKLIEAKLEENKKRAKAAHKETVKESSDAKDAASDKTDKVVTSAADSDTQKLQKSKEHKASSRKPFKSPYSVQDARKMMEVVRKDTSLKKEREAGQKEKESLDAKDASKDETGKGESSS